MVTLSEEVAADVTVDWTASRETDDTAETDDFADLSAANGTLTIAASETAATFTVATAQDADEDDETFTVTLSDQSPSGVQLAKATATGTIGDDDGLPEVTIAADEATVTEGTDAAFTLSRTGAAAAGLTVTVAVSQTGSVLTSGSPPSSVTFAAGAVQAGLTLATDDDDTEGDDGMVTVTLRAGSGYELGRPASATVTIIDDDFKVTIEADEATVTEGTDAAFTLSRTGSATAALEVAVAVSQTGSVLTSGSPPSSVTFAAGAVQAGLTLATDDDDTDGDDGRVTVTLQAGRGYEVGRPASAEVEVTDNDVPVDLVLSVPATVAEDAGTVTVTVTATTAEDAPPGTSVRFVLTRVSDEGTAESGTDHAVVSADLNLRPEDFKPETVDGNERYRAVWTHEVTIENDDEVEDDETLVLALERHAFSSALHTVGGGDGPVTATVTIIDDDFEVTIAADKATVTEGTGAAFTLSRTGAAPIGAVAVAVTQTGSVLTSGSPPSSVTFAAGAAEAGLTLATDDDDTDGDDGRVTVTLQAGRGYEVGRPASAEVEVTDNDVPVDLVLSVPATVAEDAGTVTVTVTATTAEDARPPPGTSVPFSLNSALEGTAASPTDHVAVSEEVFLRPEAFEPETVDGQPRYRAVWTHEVTIENDGQVEADETLVLALERHSSSPAIHTVGGGDGPVTATVTITDDDPPVGLTADPTPDKVVLTWGHGDGDPATSRLTGHEYRRRTSTAGTWGDWGVWTAIRFSGFGGINYETFTLGGLGTDVTYGFELRAVDDEARGVVASVEATTFEPMSVALCCNSPTTFVPSDDPGERLLRLTFRFSHLDGLGLGYFDKLRPTTKASSSAPART